MSNASDLHRVRDETQIADELLQAKALLLLEIPLSESSIESIGRGFIRRATLDLPLNEPTLAAHRYLGLTAEQVRDAYIKWIRPNHVVQVTEGPSPR